MGIRFCEELANFVPSYGEVVFAIMGRHKKNSNLWIAIPCNSIFLIWRGILGPLHGIKFVNTHSFWHVKRNQSNFLYVTKVCVCYFLCCILWKKERKLVCKIYISLFAIYVCVCIKKVLQMPPINLLSLECKQWLIFFYIKCRLLILKYLILSLVCN